MSEFVKLKEVVRKQFDKMAGQQLFAVNIDKEVLWNLYLDSFPPGTNPIFKTRREFDCNCCKSFVRRVGNVVTINKDLELVSIWDVKTDSIFQPVVDAMSAFVKKQAIQNMFLSVELTAGTDVSRQLLDDKTVVNWEHFFVKFPKEYVHTSKTESVESVLGVKTADYQVFSRSMKELTLDAGQTVLELIDSNSIYRGEEQKAAVLEFIKEKKAFDAVASEKRDIYCWTRLGKTFVTRVRNSALGTLLIDLSEGVGVDEAVTKFEKVMAPTNYKRPKAVFTKKMVEDAEAKIKELGFEDSLGRRHAVIDDITVNNVLFVDRSAKKAMGIFDELKSDVAVNPKKFNKVEEVSIDDFVAKILPHASTIEILPEGRHEGNLMNLVAPINKHAPSMFKWDNNFSWAYKGDVADSMKQRVKAAGGKVDGVLRFSIQWNEEGNNHNDLDAHCVEPGGHEIDFRNKVNRITGGNLDVDIMHPEKNVAVENITWPVQNQMKEGQYRFFVHCFSHRGGTNGFRAEIEYGGEIYSFSYDTDIKHGACVEVATIQYSHADGIKFITSLDSSMQSRDVWGVKTGNFAKVTSLMMSPNHWDGQQGRGNRHFFFITEGCKCETSPRGFFNEYLKEDLMKHKQVFEALGSKMRVASSDDQLAGFGFSSTVRNDVLVRVTGKTSRVLKVQF